MEGVNEHICDWSVSQVLSWLQSTNDGQFESYCKIFKQHQIYGDALLSLTNDILRDEMKIMAYGARHALLKAIENLKESYMKKLSDITKNMKKSKNIAISPSNANNKLSSSSLISKSINFSHHNNSHNSHRKASISSITSTLSHTYCTGDIANSNADTIINDNFQNLNTMKKHGVVDPSEYIKQAKLIVKAVTGTTIKIPITQSVIGNVNNLNRLRSGFFKFEDQIPDFDEIKYQNVIKYDWNRNSLGWQKSNVTVKIATNPFSRGSLRVSYYCLEYKISETEYDENNKRKNQTNLKKKKKNNISKTETNLKQIPNVKNTTIATYTNIKKDDLVARLLGFESRSGGNLIVAKQSIDLTESVKTYFNDVRTQSVAQLFAENYNTYNPPKKVAFIKASVIQSLSSSISEQFFCVEDYLHGSYTKHLDNYGGDEGIRNTPSSFAHFTYEASQHRLLVCDIQGVGDLYTDPQIHTFDGKGFGKGNLGIDGMIKFLKTHQCNAICKHLRLELVNPPKPIVYGTRPAKMYMEQKNIKIVDHIDLMNDKYHKIPEIPIHTLNDYYVQQIYNINKKEESLLEIDNNNNDDKNADIKINKDNNNENDDDDEDDDDCYHPLTPLLPPEDDIEDTNCGICRDCIVL